jgi:hypothetical protein
MKKLKFSFQSSLFCSKNHSHIYVRAHFPIFAVYIKINIVWRDLTMVISILWKNASRTNKWSPGRDRIRRLDVVVSQPEADALTKELLVTSQLKIG